MKRLCINFSEASKTEKDSNAQEYLSRIMILTSSLAKELAFLSGTHDQLSCRHIISTNGSSYI